MSPPALCRSVLLLPLCLAALLCHPAAVTAQDFGFVLSSRTPASPDEISAVRIPRGTPPVAAISRGDEVFLFPVQEDGSLGSPTRLYRGRAEITDLTVDESARRLAVANAAGDVTIVGLEDGTVLAELRRAHRKGASSVAFTSDGRYLVSGGEKGDLRVFTGDGTDVGDLAGGMGHDEAVVAVFPLPGSRRVLSLGEDRKVILWDLDTLQAVRPTLMDMDIRSAALGGRDTLALGLQSLQGNLHRGMHRGRISARETRVTDTVRILDPQSGNRILELEGLTQDLDSIGVTPDGRFVAVAGSRSRLSVFDAASGQIVTEIPLTEPATAMDFSPDGRWLLVGTEAGDLTLFELDGVAPAPDRPGTHPGAPLVVVIVEPKILVPEDRAGRVPTVDRGSLEIRGRIKSPVPLASLQVDGREITSIVPVDGDLLFTAFVPLEEPGERTIDVVAENVAGTTWTESFVVERTPRVETEISGPGSRRALIVGISDYADSGIDLQYAAADARALHDFLTAPERGPARFDDDDVLLLLDEDATVREINTGLRDFLQRARENDFVLVFFAGHGMPDPNQLDDFYLLAHDTNPHNVAGTGIPMHHVREALAQVRSRDVLILTDSCHSAGVAAPRGMRNLQTNPIHRSFLQRMRHSSGGMAILTASEAAQVSLEGPEWGGHGVFSHFLLQGLEGQADHDGDRIVTLGEVMEYVRSQVMEATGNQQIPAIGPTSFDRRYPLVPLAVED